MSIFKAKWLTVTTCVKVTGTDPHNGFTNENRKNHLASKTYRGCPMNKTNNNALSTIRKCKK